MSTQGIPPTPSHDFSLSRQEISKEEKLPTISQLLLSSMQPVAVNRSFQANVLSSDAKVSGMVEKNPVLHSVLSKKNIAISKLMEIWDPKIETHPVFAHPSDPKGGTLMDFQTFLQMPPEMKKELRLVGAFNTDSLEFISFKKDFHPESLEKHELSRADFDLQLDCPEEIIHLDLGDLELEDIIEKEMKEPEKEERVAESGKQQTRSVSLAKKSTLPKESVQIEEGIAQEILNEYTEIIQKLVERSEEIQAKAKEEEALEKKEKAIKKEIKQHEASKDEIKEQSLKSEEKLEETKQYGSEQSQIKRDKKIEHRSVSVVREKNIQDKKRKSAEKVSQVSKQVLTFGRQIDQFQST